VICPRCAEAADNRRPRKHHCKGTGGAGSVCDCQHKTDRYTPKETRA
jgi:hypothetical protein